MRQERLALGLTSVLVTGSRRWTDRERLERELLDEVVDVLVRRHLIVLRSSDPYAYLERKWTGGRVRLVVGDCDTGADQMTVDWCDKHSVDRALFEARPDLPSPRRFHERNQAMVSEGRPDRFLAFWDGRDPADGSPSGTLDTMKRCVRARVPGRIIPA